MFSNTYLANYLHLSLLFWPLEIKKNNDSFFSSHWLVQIIIINSFTSVWEFPKLPNRILCVWVCVWIQSIWIPLFFHIIISLSILDDNSQSVLSICHFIFYHSKVWKNLDDNHHHWKINDDCRRRHRFFSVKMRKKIDKRKYFVCKITKNFHFLPFLYKCQKIVWISF